jgi:hypothetical protein
MSTTSADYQTERSSQGQDPETIARKIDSTRGEVNQTLDALQAKLSPGQMLDRVLEFARENGGEFASNLGNSVKRNPLPVVLTGIGLLWMIASRGSAQSSSQIGRSGAGTGIGKKVEGIGQSVSDATSSARERLSDMADTVSDTAGAVSDRVAGATQTVASQAKRAREGFSRLMDEQPLLVGSLGVAVGALIGASLPSTETEDRWLGEARDRTVRRAKEVGSEQSSKAREFAAETTESMEGSTPPRPS